MKKTIVEILKKEREEAHDDLLIWANDDEIQSLANKIEKQLLLHNVSQQRELLLAYENYTSEMITGKTNDRTAKSLVDGFLANNCG